MRNFDTKKPTIMKTLGIILLLVCGGTSYAFSQGLDVWKPQTGLENRFSNPDWSVSKYPLLITPEALKADSMYIVVPRSLLFERTIPNFPDVPQYVSTMPIYALPDPESRMPIRPFDESQNYTILEKAYK
jgi:hypothetical protein